MLEVFQRLPDRVALYDRFVYQKQEAEPALGFCRIEEPLELYDDKIAVTIAIDWTAAGRLAWRPDYTIVPAIQSGDDGRWQIICFSIKHVPAERAGSAVIE